MGSEELAQENWNAVSGTPRDFIPMYVHPFWAAQSFMVSTLKTVIGTRAFRQDQNTLLECYNNTHASLYSLSKSVQKQSIFGILSLIAFASFQDTNPIIGFL